MATIAENIAILTAEFAKIDGIDPDGPTYRKLCGLLDSCTDDALKAAYEAKIKFVSKLALNRMIRRGLVVPA